jgi:hypothetical protein
MNNNVCPHCRTEVPHGASVCTGCQAEVEYGTPFWAFAAVFVVAAILGVAVGGTAGWIVFAILLAAGLVGCSKVFANRVSFKRIYKTK